MSIVRIQTEADKLLARINKPLSEVKDPFDPVAFRAAEAQRPEGTPDPFLLPESTRLRDRLPTEIVQDIQAQRPDTGPSAFARAGRKAATGVSRFLLDPGPGLRGAAGAIGGAAADVGGFLADPLPKRVSVDSPLARSSAKALERAFAESPLASNLELSRRSAKVTGAFLSASQQQMLSDMTEGRYGAPFPDIRPIFDPDNPEGFDERFDTFTDQLNLLPGQQGFNELITEPFNLIPGAGFIGLGPRKILGAGARQLARGAPAKEALRISEAEIAKTAAQKEAARLAAERARRVGPLPELPVPPPLMPRVRETVPDVSRARRLEQTPEQRSTQELIEAGGGSAKRTLDDKASIQRGIARGEKENARDMRRLAGRVDDAIANRPEEPSVYTFKTEPPMVGHRRLKTPKTLDEAENQIDEIEDLKGDLDARLDEMDNPDTVAGVKLQDRITAAASYLDELSSFKDTLEVRAYVREVKDTLGVEAYLSDDAIDLVLQLGPADLTLKNLESMSPRELARVIREGAEQADQRAAASLRRADELVEQGFDADLTAIEIGAERIGLQSRPTPRPVAEALPLSTSAIPDNTALMVNPGPVTGNVIGLRPVQAGLSKTQRLTNIARATVSKLGESRPVLREEISAGAFRERDRVAQSIDSVGNRFGAIMRIVAKPFVTDEKGRIRALVGIDPSMTGAPTIADVAARFPGYKERLSSTQISALETIKRELEPFQQMLTEYGFEPHIRADIVDGGFYIPRGRAGIEGADEPLMGAGGFTARKTSAERRATFISQSMGIDEGFKYAPFHEAMESFAKEQGRKVADQHVANALAPYGRTAAERIDSQLRHQVTTLRSKIRTRLKTYRAQLTREQTQMRAAADLDRLTVRFEKTADAVEERLNSQLLKDDFSLAMDDAMTGTERELFQAVRAVERLMKATKKADTRVDLTGKAQDETNAALNTLQDELRDLNFAWKVAKEAAQRPGLGEGFIAFPGLEGRSFPETLAAAANEFLAANKKISGEGAAAIETYDAVNNLYRGMNATLDNSHSGIQSLLGFWNDKRAWYAAMKTGFHAWGKGGEEALGQALMSFDKRVVNEGRLTSDLWTKLETPLRLGGGDTEFKLGRGITTRIANLPLVRNANRAFGYQGDIMRLEWADDMLKTELKHRSLQQIIDSGDAARIADITNNMTGWSKNRAGGRIGDWLLFAPRFFQSRLTVITKGAMGMRPGAALDQRIARNSLIKMIGWGTVTTFSINEMLGNETDYDPIVDGKYNPNFMRIRYGGRDWSVFGTWDSMARLIVMTASGDPLSGFRGLSSGIVSNAWDIISGTDFVGKHVRDDPLQLSVHLTRSFAPFSTEELPEQVTRGVRGVVTGRLREDVIPAFITITGEVHGAKSAPFSFNDVRDIVASELHGVSYNAKDEDDFFVLTDEQRREVNEDERVAERIADFEDEPAKPRQRIEQAFDSFETESLRLEGELRDSLDKGLNNVQMRKRVSKFRQARFIAGSTAFGLEDIQEALNEDKHSLTDQLRMQYWLANAPEDEYGSLDFAIRDTIREGVLRVAEEQGIPAERITKRRVKVEDPEIAQLIERMDFVNDKVLKDFYNLDLQIIGSDTATYELWRKFKSLPQNEQTAFLRRNPTINRVKKIVDIERNLLRRNDELADAVRAVYWGTMPQNRENRIRFLRGGVQALLPIIDQAQGVVSMTTTRSVTRSTAPAQPLTTRSMR